MQDWESFPSHLDGRNIPFMYNLRDEVRDVFPRAANHKGSSACTVVSGGSLSRCMSYLPLPLCEWALEQILTAPRGTLLEAAPTMMIHCPQSRKG